MIVRVLFFATLLAACRPSSASAPPAPITRATEDATFAHEEADAATDASEEAVPGAAQDPPREAGPFEIKFSGDRNVYYAIPPRKGPKRVIAMLHGVCNPPGYACGYWWPAAIEKGVLVCPEGNARCAWSCGDCRADRKEGPPSWEEPFPDIDKDLERSIAKVLELHPDEFSRDGAILAGFSRGSYVAAYIAQVHPGRWPYLILNEADTEITAAQLRAAKVRAVVLMAGAIGLNAGPEKKTFDELVKAGFPAKYIAMPKAGHFYSENIQELMKEALDFFETQEEALSNIK